MRRSVPNNGRFAMLAALSVVVLASAAPLLAQERAPHPRAYETEYLVTDALETDLDSRQPLQRGRQLFRQRMTFAALAVSTGEVAQASNGEVFVPAGAQFYRAATASIPVWCTANMRMPTSAFMTVIVGRVYSQYCIVDEDGDGVFRHFFKRARTIESLPNVRGRIPGNMREIRPIALTPVDPNSLQTRYFVGLTYLRTAGGDSPFPIFQLIAGSEHGSLFVEQPFRGPGGAVANASVAGSLLELSSDSAGTSARVVRGLEVGPLRIRGTNCGIINGC